MVDSAPLVLTRNAIGVLLTYVVLVGGFALWQRQQVGAAHRVALEAAAHEPEVYDDTMSRVGWVAVGALALSGGLGLAFYGLLVQRGRQVTDLLQRPSPVTRCRRPGSATISPPLSRPPIGWGGS